MLQTTKQFARGVCLYLWFFDLLSLSQMTNIFLNYLNFYSKKKNLNLEGGGGRSLFCQGKYLLFYLNNILSCVVTLDSCCIFYSFTQYTELQFSYTNLPFNWSTFSCRIALWYFRTCALFILCFRGPNCKTTLRFLRLDFKLRFLVYFSNMFCIKF
uniref:Uncharacterized protein n=2 Tax=Cacopsylla melanoneura TaxID=428564 RepID=A0A8D8XC78_9HEMI